MPMIAIEAKPRPKAVINTNLETTLSSVCLPSKTDGNNSTIAEYNKQPAAMEEIAAVAVSVFSDSEPEDKIPMKTPTETVQEKITTKVSNFAVLKERRAPDKTTPKPKPSAN